MVVTNTPDKIHNLKILTFKFRNDVIESFFKSVKVWFSQA